MKKLLISLLINMMLFCSIPVYALTLEEAETYVGLKNVVILIYQFLGGVAGYRCDILGIRTVEHENKEENYNIYILEKFNGEVVSCRIEYIYEVLTKEK